MSETYTYSIIDDFPNQAVVIGKLKSQIEDSTAVTVALISITTDEGNCHIDFVDVLPPGEETALDGIVAAHDGVPYPIYPDPDVKYVFGKSGLIYDGNLWTVGDISSSDQGYLIQRDITIIGITIKATEGDYTTKEIYIQNDGVDISSMFQLDSGLIFTAKDLSIDVDVGGVLQIHVTGTGSLANAMAQIDIIWR